MDVPKKPIAVIGAGSWGTALAMALGRRGNRVQLWGNEPDVIQAMQTSRVNDTYLPGCPLPDSIQVVNEFESCLADVRDVLIVVPSHVFRSGCEQMKAMDIANIRLSLKTIEYQVDFEAFLVFNMVNKVKFPTVLF